MALAALTRQQLKSLDATAATAGLSASVLMERAGMALAEFLEQRTSGEDSLLFLIGTGNNGGDGLVAARHLSHAGRRVSVLLAGEPRSLESRTNRKLVEHMGIPVQRWEEGFSMTPYDVVVDCLLGYSQRGAPEGAVAAVVEAAREKTCLACDLPTGVDANTGAVSEPCLRAQATLSFSAPKEGFHNPEAQAACGEITIAGIGIPAFAYRLIIPAGEFLIEGTRQYP